MEAGTTCETQHSAAPLQDYPHQRCRNLRHSHTGNGDLDQSTGLERPVPESPAHRPWSRSQHLQYPPGRRGKVELRGEPEDRGSNRQHRWTDESAEDV